MTRTSLSRYLVICLRRPYTDSSPVGCCDGPGGRVEIGRGRKVDLDGRQRLALAVNQRRQQAGSRQQRGPEQRRANQRGARKAEPSSEHECPLLATTGAHHAGRPANVTALNNMGVFSQQARTTWGGPASTWRHGSFPVPGVTLLAALAMLPRAAPAARRRPGPPTLAAARSRTRRGGAPPGPALVPPLRAWRRCRMPDAAKHRCQGGAGRTLRVQLASRATAPQPPGRQPGGRGSGHPRPDLRDAGRVRRRAGRSRRWPTAGRGRATERDWSCTCGRTSAGTTDAA